MRRIYFDHAASTPLDPVVLNEIIRVSKEYFGNASSLHREGTRAKEYLEHLRSDLAGILECQPDELYFTSGGTESNNWALKGYALANRSRGNHILISSMEHDCVINACRWLQIVGFRITQMPVDGEGKLDPETFRQSIKPDTILASVMQVNNELGTIEPIREIGQIAREHSVALHTDACQSFGKILVIPNQLRTDMISINAHKIYGPKGVGALYIRKGSKIEPLFHGGGQEHGYRSTTENIPGIAGFVMAAKICLTTMKEEQERLKTLKEKLVNDLSTHFDNWYTNGSIKDAVPGIFNFSFRGMEGDVIRLILWLDEAGVAVSGGSACSSNHLSTGSHVLKAIGRNPVEARGAVRLSMGRFNSLEEVEMFGHLLKNKIQNLTSIFS